MDKMDYKIWKYRKGRSIKRLFELSDIGFQFLGIAVIMLSVIAMAVLEIVVSENVENERMIGGSIILLPFSILILKNEKSS